MPPKEEYEAYLPGIWERNWLTNMGPLSLELEASLKSFLAVSNLLYVSSGTIGLQLAIAALELSGEIITTPFSFVATTSSIVWQHCKPVFADIDKDTLNISVEHIEKLITSKTSAILATHLFGNPCEVDAIEQLARKHGIKIIYDAAHAFAVQIGGGSIHSYGDLSICSLHATKAYHSVEGGLIISNNEQLIKKLSFMRNFGFNGPEKFAELGINAKNSEFHAAMGLVNLRHHEEIIGKRAAIVEQYDSKLHDFGFQKPAWNPKASRNFEYYPLIFNTPDQLKKVIGRMNERDIYPRRYFYPSLTQSLPYVERTSMPVTEFISERILCLPLYTEMTDVDIDQVCACFNL